MSVISKDNDIVRKFELELYLSDINKIENQYLNLIYHPLFDKICTRDEYDRTREMMKWTCAICHKPILIHKRKYDVENFVCDTCKKEYNNKSMLDSNRVYIIKEADKLNLAAANSILKFLEEPEDNIVAILLTKNRYQIIDTILSRCQIIALKRKTPSNVDSDKALTFIKYMLKNGELFVNYKEILDNIMPDKLVARQILEQVKLIFIDYLEGNDVMIDLSNVDKNKVVTWVLILESEMKKLDYNVNYKLWLDSLYVKLIGGDRYV